MKIGVFTIGDVAPQFVHRLICGLEERFLYPFFLESKLSLPTSAFNIIKKQYFAPTLLNSIKQTVSSETRYALGITPVDLYGISLNYILGDAVVEDRVAISSYHRLNPEFYGHQADESILFDRILKESMHQVAHLLSTKHCYNPSCVMYYSSNIYDIDKKWSLFCPECERKLIKASIYDRLKE